MGLVPSLDPSWTQVLQGKVVILGIGNSLKGDDGFGPSLVAQLQNRVKALCFDAGTSPENYLGRVARENPDTILLVDAVHLEEPAGQAILLKEGELLKSGFTTHDLSPHLLIDYLKGHSKASIYLLGVQPRTTALGDSLSEPVQTTLQQLAGDIQKALHA